MPAPVRALQIVYSMNRAGVETWLMDVLRHSDRAGLRMDFMTDTTEPGDFDDEIRRLGGRVIPCTRAARPLQHAREFRRILRDGGGYDIVHSHVAHSGFELAIAATCGVPVRIAHSHNDIQQFFPPDRLRRLFLKVTNPWVRRFATHGLAASAAAAAAMFGNNWKSDRRWQVLFCGRDLSAFAPPAEPRRLDFCRQFGLPDDARVVGHVGRLAEQKNHALLLDIAEQVLSRRQDVHFVLVGDGPLRDRVLGEIERRGMAGRVHWIGVRDNVADLMLHLFDLFLFPSLFEGLGLVLVEAQAAGLPCIISSVIPQEVDVVEELMTRLSLEEPAERWADCVLSQLDGEPPVPREDAYRQMQNSPFTVEQSCRQLLELYHDALRDVAESAGHSVAAGGAMSSPSLSRSGEATGDGHPAEPNSGGRFRSAADE
ncbi:Putative glycosyltransferase EpsF [Maioricimonas rarisocia]|uniref:Glycosyltransferase EpsF n=2 Tax=Maioricimonas rarisocia TaxID=2528026 RepID=A0A517Z8N0_9PLAN|nr:Putative glycosyltransferase EpsF [Maioricimonas rarisocia]